MMCPDFDIAYIVSQVGETFTLRVPTTSINDEGDITETGYDDYTIQGVIQEYDGSDKEVEEGVLRVGDITVWVDEDESNVDKLVNDNYVIRGSLKYRIKNVIHNDGHYEVYAYKVK